MTIKEFAAKQRLRTKLDEDGTDIVPGKLGHIYEHDDDLLGVMVIPEEWQNQYWTYAKKGLRAVGCMVVQDGDYEGAATFDSRDERQVRHALKAAEIHRIRVPAPPSAKQLEARKTFTRMKWSSTRARPKTAS